LEATARKKTDKETDELSTDVYQDHDEATREDDKLPNKKDTPRHHRLEPGDTLESVSDQFGVPVDELVKRNDRQLMSAAQARGFPAHTHRRPREDGSGFDTGYHTFAGEELELRDPVEGEPGYEG
jgi:hypothetical protein